MQLALSRSARTADACIVDGNYPETLDLRLEHAQTVVLLDIVLHYGVHAALHVLDSERDVNELLHGLSGDELSRDR